MITSIPPCPKHVCRHIPYGEIPCAYAHHCERCEIADRIRTERRERAVYRNNPLPLLGYADVLKPTPSGGGREWVFLPIALRSESMEAHGIARELYYQIFIATGGPGMFSCNPSGAIDGYLLADPTHELTFYRQECIGIPNERACEQYYVHYLVHPMAHAKGKVMRMDRD